MNTTKRDFGDVFAGEELEQNFQVLNAGTKPLELERKSTLGEHFSSAPADTLRGASDQGNFHGKAFTRDNESSQKYLLQSERAQMLVSKRSNVQARLPTPALPPALSRAARDRAETLPRNQPPAYGSSLAQLHRCAGAAPAQSTG